MHPKKAGAAEGQRIIFWHIGIYLEDSVMWGKNLRIFVVRFHNKKQQEKRSDRVPAVLFPCIVLFGVVAFGAVLSGSSIKNSGSFGINEIQTVDAVAGADEVHTTDAALEFD
ncbi:MAG: hypothetical protein J6C37_07255, partial [Roseburia sp.]|nr:hypothetical protein [Roseburia sp.]